MMHDHFDLIGAIKSLAPAFLGAWVSLMSVPQSVAGISNLFSASIIGFFGGNALVEYVAMDPRSWVAFFLKFSIGVFGLAVLREIMLKIPDLISAISKRLTGG